MAWASTEKVVLGCIAFGVWWILAVFPAVPCLPIGRTAGSLLGAALMVVFQIISPTAAFAAVDLPILGLLFGTMVVSVYLERADLFKYLGNALSWKSRGGKDLLCRVCLLAAVSSALFTNDTTCVVLTEFVLKLCRQKNLPPQPFLIALACSSNIGSAATPIGNPQNLVIAVQSKIGFGKFLIGIIPAVAVGLVVNTLGLLLLYWQRLSGNPSQEEGVGGAQLADVDVGNKENIPQNDQPSQLSNSDCMGNLSGDGEQLAVDHFTEIANQGCEGLSALRQPHAKPREPDIQRRNSDSIVVELASYYRAGRGGEVPSAGFNPVRGSATSELLGLDHRPSISLPRQLGPDETTGLETPDHIAAGNLPSPSNETEGGTTRLERRKRRKRRLWKISVYFVTMGMLAALLAGLSLPWSALTAAVVLMVLDFSDAGPSLDQVSYSLLVFFTGMFITVAGFNATGAPGQLWSAVEPHARIDSVSGLSVLSIVVTILSNVASNVPTVLLLGPRVAASAAATAGVSVTKAWLILAWVSTVAGNLTLVGSAANLIVSEQARRAKVMGYNLSFWNHLRFGVPATLIVIAVGLPLVHG